MADFSNLTQKRDKLNADVSALISAGTVSQSTVDALSSEFDQVDADVLAATTPNPPPVPLDFGAFDAAVVAFKADANLKQADVDALTGAIKTATV